MENPLQQKVNVKYTGPFGDPSGYGEANRNAIAALNAVGVSITTQRVTYSKGEIDYGFTYELAQKLEGNPIEYDIKILHVPSDGYLQYLEPAKYHIGHLFWETDGMSKEWVWNCNLMDEIWTGGHIHKENFLKAGIKVPIKVFPQAIEADIKVLRPIRVVHRSGFLFYSVFEWIERKNPKALLKAYWEEFQNDTDVTLLLKVYKFNGREN